MTQSPHYILRYMQIEDIPQVVALDRIAFPMPWSTRTYEFEISNRDTSHMVVVEVTNSAAQPAQGWRGWVQRLLKRSTPGIIVGYGGCWLIAGEAHISTIATHPHYRGQGLGELLLVGMLQRAIELGGEYSVLEVRESNLTAQRLYEKYEYQVEGRRKGYYRDDGEDALLMAIRPLDTAYAQRLAQRVATLRRRVDFVDQFTQQNQR